MTRNSLWYRGPAVEWTDTLPLGNGRLGAMMHGGVGREDIQLNEATLWSGGPYQPIHDAALPALDTVRQLVFEGRYKEAEALADRTLLARPHAQMSYQSAGNLFIEFQHEAVPGSYRRALDLETAIATTRYALLSTGISDDAAVFSRECFVSAADDLLVLRLASSKPGALSFEIWLDSPQPGDWLDGEDTRLDYRGRNFGEHGLDGALSLGIGLDLRVEGGRAERRGRRLVVRCADAALITLDIATSFRRFDQVNGDVEAALTARREAIAGKPYEALRADHIASHQSRFGRLEIDLGPGQDALPTDERIAGFAQGGDAGLAALYVQYGRYLMLASSRPGGQPANLQGIWNRSTRPPWGSKYTANINVEMNYWLPDPANLAECFEPFIGLIEGVAATGAEMARAHYGARGWVLHHNTDLWRATGPVDGSQWGLWPMGGAWLCVQAWDHAVYAGRPEALARQLLPLLEGAVQFFLDILQPLPGTDFLVTVPTLSPENQHPHGSSVCAGPAMDSQLLRDLFDAYLAASQQLGATGGLQDSARAARARLPADRIGRGGQLQEWLEDWDLDAPERDHRHVSHLYGLYPSQQIAPDQTPALAAAAKTSLELRGDEATGWAIAWRLNLWARLGEAERAHDVLKLLLSPERSYCNLFDAHPPFQIDGNFGGAAGILEMLVQSREGLITLLPALPSAWPKGRVSGLRARGNVTLDLAWEAGRPLEVALLSGTARTLALRWNGAVKETRLEAGAKLVLGREAWDSTRRHTP